MASGRMGPAMKREEQADERATRRPRSSRPGPDTSLGVPGAFPTPTGAFPVPSRHQPARSRRPPDTAGTTPCASAQALSLNQATPLAAPADCTDPC